MSSTTSSRTRTLAGIPTVIPTTIISNPTDTTAPSLPTSTDSSGGSSFGGGSGTPCAKRVNLQREQYIVSLHISHDALAAPCGIMWDRDSVVYLTTANITRSSVIYRRFHRRVEEAIAAGVLLPSQTGDIAMGPGGEKPKMWEVWIDERTMGHHPSLAAEWTKVQPVAVTQLSDAPPKPKVGSSAAAPDTPPLPISAFQRLTNRLPFGLGRGRPTATTPASPEVPLPTLAYGASPAPGQRGLEPNQTPKAVKATDLTDDTNSVQVAVLIAMPDPSKPRYTPGSSPTESHADGESSDTKGKQRSSEIPSASTEEQEVPDICIGVAQARIADNPTQTAVMSEPHNSPKV
ncbi:hypothetical protein FRC10_002762 [Ceratobasidium sp. 414]|nr:hypothetical protein FRC10_002762 [Ceratobasidium sp. 414]